MLSNVSCEGEVFCSQGFTISKDDFESIRPMWRAYIEGKSNAKS